MIYDSVVCVSPHHYSIALIAIRSLLFFSETRKVFVITAKNNFQHFEELIKEEIQIILLDEDLVISDVNILDIKTYLKSKVSNPLRAGWYFQQFLKMSACYIDDIADYYLIWDSDTVLFKSLDFIDNDGRVLINPKTEHHQPYFNLINKLLGINKKVNFSFISEHLMIKKKYMQNLIEYIQEHFPNKKSWVFSIMDLIAVSELNGGFSEYETYGNFIHTNFPKSYKLRPIKSLRHGTKYCGLSPNKFDIYSLSKKYIIVSFESHMSFNRRKVWIYKKIFRMIYLIDSKVHILTENFSNNFKTANYLCQDNYN